VSKDLRIKLMFWALGAGFALAPPSVVSGNQDVVDQTGYLVVPGDSLWRLSRRLLGDPYRWPELWRANAQITDPNMIFPGMLLRVPGVIGHPVRVPSTAQKIGPEVLTPEPVAAAQTPTAAEMAEIKAAAPVSSAPISSASIDERPVNQSAGQVGARDKAAEAAKVAEAGQINAAEITWEKGEGGDTKNDTSVDKSVARSGAAKRRKNRFRSLKKSDPVDKPTRRVGYIDRLIDPSRPEDSFLDYAVTGRDTGRSGWLPEVDHSLDALGLYRNESVTGRDSFDQGLHYIARVNTRNWGQLRLNLIALDEFNLPGSIGGAGANTSSSGLVRASLEQFNLPITETIWMDNIVGTHRQVRYNPFRERPNLINYRFGAAEPDILGISTHLKFERNGLSLSAGKLGQTRGRLLPGFVRTEGQVQRAQWSHTRERVALSGEVWQTKNQTTLDNRAGYRIGIDHLFSPSTVLSFSAVRSGGQHAFLAGGSTENDFRKHDYGAYFFDPDLLWMDTRIGDDNAGGFYRYSNRRGTRTFGGSLELRRDGLSNGALTQRDTGFLSVNYARRLNRRSTISGVYGYRHTRSKRNTSLTVPGLTSDGVRHDHSLRTYFSRTHRSGASSQLGALLRTRTGDDEVMLTYGYSRSLDNDSTVEFEARQRLTGGGDSESRETGVNASWNRQFLNGGYLGLGVGYTVGRSRLDDNRGFTGYLNFEQPLSRAFDVSLQLDYSRNRAEYERDLDDTFFTGNAFEDDNFTDSREFTALLRLSYRLGGRGAKAPLASRGATRGSGRVRGVLFIDANSDGIRQANESGLAGVTVFLNSIYPVVTNSRGEYSFASVGPGDHFVFIDETTLPLPWTLVGSEYTPLTVELRRTTQLDIAISPITLADADG